NLVGELSMHSDSFRTWWAAQDVYVHRHGTKRFYHPVVGELDLAYEGLQLASDETLTIMTYSAEPGTPSGDGLELLASWAASQPDAIALGPDRV
ncbi:MmyB family transcriptional regulator, partial [Rugosimonospora acidiphila]